MIRRLLKHCRPRAAAAVTPRASNAAAAQDREDVARAAAIVVLLALFDMWMEGSLSGEGTSINHPI